MWIYELAHGMIEIKVIILHANLLLGNIKSVALMYTCFYTHVHISVSIYTHICVCLPWHLERNETVSTHTYRDDYKYVSI